MKKTLMRATKALKVTAPVATKLPLDVSKVYDMELVASTRIMEQLITPLMETSRIFDEGCVVGDYGLWNAYEKHMFEVLLCDLFTYCVCAVDPQIDDDAVYLESVIRFVLHTGGLMVTGSSPILKHIGFGASQYLKLFLDAFKQRCEANLSLTLPI